MIYYAYLRRYAPSAPGRSFSGEAQPRYNKTDALGKTTNLDQLPTDIERGVQRFAADRHITHDEAVIALIETGLKSTVPSSPIKGLTGAPMSDEDAAIVDEALSIAMEARRERSARIVGA
jgi:hypothetical protein